MNNVQLNIKQKDLLIKSIKMLLMGIHTHTYYGHPPDVAMEYTLDVLRTQMGHQLDVHWTLPWSLVWTSQKRLLAPPLEDLWTKTGWSVDVHWTKLCCVRLYTVERSFCENPCFCKVIWPKIIKNLGNLIVLMLQYCTYVTWQIQLWFFERTY